MRRHPPPPSRQVNATPAEEAGIGELLSTLGVRRPGLRVLTYEMGSKERSVSPSSIEDRPLGRAPRPLTSLRPTPVARNTLYLQGGLFSVTSRILVVDLLTKNVPPEMITGLMVLHAEQCVRGWSPPSPLVPLKSTRASAYRVNQTSLEAFIVRLYRQTNHVRRTSSVLAAHARALLII